MARLNCNSLLWIYIKRWIFDIRNQIYCGCFTKRPCRHFSDTFHYKVLQMLASNISAVSRKIDIA